MSDGVQVVWHGVHEFEAALTKLNERVERNTRAAGIQAGRELAQFASSKAPHLSGDLAGSIEAIPTGRKAGGDRVLVGPTVPYGRRVELGFKGRKSRRGVRKLRAQGINTGRRGLQATKPNPFLKDALEEFQGQYLEIHRAGWAAAIIET